MRKFLALLLPFDFMFVMFLIGANRTNSLTISHQGFVWILVGSIGFFIIGIIILILTSSRKEVTK